MDVSSVNYKDPEKTDHPDEVGFCWYQRGKYHNAYHYEYKDGVRTHAFWMLKDVPIKESLWEKFKTWLNGADT
jgi:hypothetical protein